MHRIPIKVRDHLTCVACGPIITHDKLDCSSLNRFQLYVLTGMRVPCSCILGWYNAGMPVLCDNLSEVKVQIGVQCSSTPYNNINSVVSPSDRQFQTLFTVGGMAPVYNRYELADQSMHMCQTSPILATIVCSHAVGTGTSGISVALTHVTLTTVHTFLIPAIRVY